MKGLSRKDLRWICKPDDACNDADNDKNIVHIHDGFAIGTDGYRLHAINLDKIDTVENLEIKERIVDRFNDNVTVDDVRVNARYLADAIAGMLAGNDRYKAIKLSVSKHVNSNDQNVAMICLEDEYGKTAIVMCLEDIEENE